MAAMRNYLSFGGGVNSVALHLLLLEQGVDFEAVFVHHGTDWPETYHYVAGFQWWLKANGHKPIKIIRPAVQGFSTIIDYCEHYKMVPFVTRRWCTHWFKVDALHKYFNTPAFELIGIDAGESRRAKIQTRNGLESRYPLLEQEIDRNGCVEIISKHGLPLPMKSGCYICPFQKRSQWVQLRRTHPCLFERAAILEQANIEYRISRGKKPMYLNSWPRASLKAIVDENQTQIFKQDEYPPCECGL